MCVCGNQQTSQSTLLLKKRKEMREVDESLEIMKKDHKKRMEECEERRLQFEIKQAKMREQVMRFERFIHENDAKRQRAELKAKQERKIYEEKLKEILALQEKIATLEIEQKSLSQELVTKSCYKAYLERIVEEGEHGYEEIAEILNRHATLKQANADLLSHSERLEKEVDTLRKRLVALRTERQNQILVNTSILQSLQSTLERKKQSVKNEEEENIAVMNKKKDISREYTQTLQSIKNLYGRCYNTMRVKPMFASMKESSTLVEVLTGELDLILLRITDLMEITTEAEDLLLAGGGSGLLTGVGGGMSVMSGGGGASVGGPGTDLGQASVASNNNTARSTDSKPRGR